MSAMLRALIVEDSDDDALRVVRLLSRGGYAVVHERVHSLESMRAALYRQAWDVVICDFQMPGFGGPAALALLRERDPDLPFIVVSGTIGEDTAVAMMKAGASDYVMKDNLARLVPAVERELRDAKVRQDRRLARDALRESELRFRQLAETIRDVFFIQDLTSSRMFYVSPAYEDLWGRTCESLYAQPDSWADSIHPDDRASAIEKFVEGTVTGFDSEFRIIRPNGELRWIRARGFPVLDERGQPYRTAGVASDITERKLASEELRRSESLKGAIIESSLDSLITIDREGRIVEFNPAAEVTFGVTRDLALGAPMAELIIPPRLRAAHNRGFSHLLATGEGPVLGKRLELHAIRADGTEFPIELTITASGAGSASLFTGFIRDITARKAAEEKIKRLNRVYAVLSGINSLIVRVRDRDELFSEACRIAVDAGAFRMAWIGVVDPETLIGEVVAWCGGEEGYVDLIRLTARDGMPDSDRPACRALRQSQPVICNDIATDPSVASLRDELLKRGHKSLACFPLTASGCPDAVLALFACEADVFDDDEITLLAELAGDISFALAHIKKSEQVNYLAYYDVLTGLANRTLFLERLGQKLQVTGDPQSGVAVFALDIDRFRAINDALGRQAGDELLKQVAQRLVGTNGDATRFARIGADRYAIFAAETESEKTVGRYVQKKLDACFGSPFHVGNEELRISAKVGIAIFPNDGASPDTLFRNAEAALKSAKSAGDRFVFYTEQMTARVAGMLGLENKLRQAVERDEFVLHYQPKVDLGSGRIVGVEALIRWQSPELGLVPPMKFIPIMEETGMILEVGAWALSRSVADNLRWTEMGLKAPRVAVNVSAIQLRSKNFVNTVKEAIRLGARPPGIDLEITESLIMADVESNVKKLKEIRRLGVGLAIDDFGTGYSSLAYLAKLPVQTLKIDRSFVISMLDDPDTMALVQTIISLAHLLRLKVVAEGVDSEEQAKTLRLLRCDEMQGFLFSRPVPFDAMTKLLQAELEPTPFEAPCLASAEA